MPASGQFTGPEAVKRPMKGGANPASITAATAPVKMPRTISVESCMSVIL